MSACFYPFFLIATFFDDNMCIISVLIMLHLVPVFDTFAICMQVPTEFQGLYEKHKALFKKEVNGALSSFGLVVEQMQSNRMALLLKDVSAAIATKEAAPEDPIDLTFDVPADVQMGEHGRARSDEEEPAKDDVAAATAVDRKSVV